MSPQLKLTSASVSIWKLKSLSSRPDAFVIIGTLYESLVLRIRISVSDEAADVVVAMVVVGVVVKVELVSVVVDEIVDFKDVVVVDFVVVDVVVVVSLVVDHDSWY